MNTLLVAALIALTANSCLGAPSNDVQVITEEIETKVFVFLSLFLQLGFLKFILKLVFYFLLTLL